MAKRVLLRKGNLRTVGRCIYCWPKKTVTTSLSDEHIVPRGLGGDQFLKDASCEDCRNITQSFEREVINGTFWILRVLHDIRNKGKKHPKPPVKIIGSDGENRVIHLPQEEIPVAVALPLFGPAKLLKNYYGDKSNPEGVWTMINPECAENAPKLGIYGMPMNLARKSFSRMLCKIAHCNAVQELGLDGFTPLLCDLIKGEEDDYTKYVGVESPPYPKRYKSVHLIALYDRLDPMVTMVQLFASVGAPGYHVVTGHAPEVPFLNNITL